MAVPPHSTRDPEDAGKPRPEATYGPNHTGPDVRSTFGDVPHDQDPLELEVVHPGERDPAAVDALLEALAEFCVDAWLARRGRSPGGNDVAA